MGFIYYDFSTVNIALIHKYSSEKKKNRICNLCCLLVFDDINDVKGLFYLC